MLFVRFFDEALCAIRTDIAEGADVVMVKPAVPVPRRDPAREGRDRVPTPRIMERRVRDGEAAAMDGWLDERRVVLLLTPTPRAGADLIVTYRAKDAADWLRG